MLYRKEDLNPLGLVYTLLLMTSPLMSPEYPDLPIEPPSSWKGGYVPSSRLCAQQQWGWVLAEQGLLSSLLFCRTPY